MDRKNIKGYDFSGDILKPRDVLEQLRAHDNRMDDDKHNMALAKAAYSTKFWQYIEGQEDYNTAEYNRLDQIEVNRIKPALSGYLSSLYPRKLEIVFTPSPYTTGSPQKAEMVVNDWMNQTLMRERILSASRQALLYKGAGAKIGYDSAAEGMDRVWMRVFPYWEMVLDADVHDWEDARFVGHVSYQDRQEIIREYGLDEYSVAGSARDDYLSSYMSSRYRTQAKNETSEGDNQAFCRVLEFCNLVDDFYDLDGTKYKGRLEIYVLDEGYDEEPFPVYMGPLPLVDSKGQPMAHVVPLIFEHEPEYPYRGLAYADQLMPQQKELNAMRSFVSNSSRRDARIYVARKGALDADAYTDLKSGEDGLIIEIDDQYAGNLRDVVVPIQHAPVSSTVLQTMSLADNDIERQMTLSPAALGMVTKATAEEIRAVERHTESEFGRHAEKRDMFLLELVKRCLSAHIAAMYDVGDSEGAEQHLDEEGLELDQDELEDKREDEGLEQEDYSEEAEEPEETEEAEEQDEEESFKPHMMYAPDSDESEMVETYERHIELGEQGWGHDDDESNIEDTPEPRREEEEARPEERSLMLRMADGEIIEVEAEDLDSDFDIGFAESGRTPMADAEVRQNLLGLMDRLMQLYDMMNKGGPQGLLAEELMRTLHDKFDLPKNLHPDYLKGRQKDAEEQASQKQQQQPQQPGQAPSGNLGSAIQQIQSLPPEQALAQLERVFVDNPQALQMIDQAKQMPPEDQAEAVRILTEALSDANL
tara:strand:- start:3005 stop:5284 length:2280 start_codon:yes stop_codon:yes gene_type:complete